MARVMVYIIAWVGVLDNAGAGPYLRDEWIDITAQGSAALVPYKAAVAEEPPGNHKAVVTQYHVYFADGGHGRYKERDYLILEKSLWPSVPTSNPSALVPTPEYLPPTQTSE
ncbi:hypothetical protein PHB09_184 [Pseudomonas phage PHB09]|uniref:Uncharacterized protein n=1 Tax=Pseudomonas phage PHB09 TaxID=2867265 RepID=A0AAE8XF90_9CAUD|nr:hypothetical protein QGX10_gp183 [Pseudomonas phage PHB09]UAV84679.1 hypothetical protein PHB09_184 [Pseudomonas phage PHB09]